VSCCRLDTTGKNSIPDTLARDARRDSTPIPRYRSSVPTGSPVLQVQWAVELRCSDGSHTSPCPAASHRETSCSASFHERRHQNSLADVARNVPRGSVRIHLETAVHSMPGHATQACATAAFHPSVDAARCVRPADCFRERLASCSSPVAEDYWSVRLPPHSSLVAARCSQQAAPRFRAERARELDPTRFPARAESSATASVARSCQRTVSVHQQRSRHD